MEIENPEFAPEHSVREKIKLLLKYLLIFIPLFAATKWLFFPWFYEYLEVAHCFKYGEFTGSQLVFYGMLVGFPLSLLLFLFFTEGVRNIRVLKLGQHPLPGEKVFRPTKYTYGRMARIKTIPIALVLLLLVWLSIYGVSAAGDIVSMVEDKSLVCSND